MVITAKAPVGAEDRIDLHRTKLFGTGANKQGGLGARGLAGAVKTAAARPHLLRVREGHAAVGGGPVYAIGYWFAGPQPKGNHSKHEKPEHKFSIPHF